MTGSAVSDGRCRSVACRREEDRERVQGEGGARDSSPGRGWRITGSDRDFSLELDVGYRSDSVSPKGLYDGREFILDRGESSRGGEGGRDHSQAPSVADFRRGANPS